MRTPPPDSSKVPVTLSAVRRLLALAIPYRRLLTGAGILALVSTSVSLSLPLVARQALDRALKTRSLDRIDQTALAMLLLVVAASSISFTQYLIVSYTGNRIVLEMRQRLFAHLQRLPVAFFDRTRSGDLTSHLSTDVALLQQTLTGDLVDLAGNILRLVGGIVLALAIDWRLTLVVVGPLTVAVGAMVLLGARLRKITRQTLDAVSDAMGGMTEALGNIRLTKAFAREAHENQRAEAKLQRVFTLSLRSSRFEGGVGMVAGVGFTGVLIGAMWYGGRSVLSGQMSVGSLLAFLLTVSIISGPMASLASLYTRLQRAIGAAERLFAILDDTPEPADRADAGPFPDGPGAVRFEAIDFRYVEETPVLCGLSLDVPPGRVTAVVGASGAGKTTLAALLYRFYEAQEGLIAIDGVPITQIRRHDLRAHIGLVPQEPALFNGTLRENVRYGKLTASDEEVAAAAQAANVMEFVNQFPDGFETVVGERGVTLSGGQRQRVAIARAILKDPRILVLDEATSALDTRSESLVREALDRLMQGRTTLVIAHRLATIRDADQIAVIENGQIVERGTYDDLMGASGRFAALNNLDERS